MDIIPPVAADPTSAGLASQAKVMSGWWKVLDVATVIPRIVTSGREWLAQLPTAGEAVKFEGGLSFHRRIIPGHQTTGIGEAAGLVL